MLFGDGVNDLLGALFFAEGEGDPGVFEHVGDLAEKGEDAFQASGEQFVNPVFDGAFVAQVVDIDRIVDLADALDAAFALFETGGVPGEVKVDEGAKTLEVETFRGGVGAEEQAQGTFANALFEGFPFGGGPGAIEHQPRAGIAGIQANGFVREFFGEFLDQPPEGIVILAEVKLELSCIPIIQILVFMVPSSP